MNGNLYYLLLRETFLPLNDFSPKIVLSTNAMDEKAVLLINIFHYVPCPKRIS